MGQDARLGADPLAWLKNSTAEPAPGASRTPPGATPPAGRPNAPADTIPPAQGPDTAGQPFWTTEVLARCPAPLLVIDSAGRLLLANQAMADLTGEPLARLTDITPATPIFLNPGPASLADLARSPRSQTLRLRLLPEQGPGQAVTARLEPVAGPEGEILAVFLAPDQEAEAADPEGLNGVLDSVGCPKTEAAGDKAASELLRTRVLFKSWLLRRQSLLRCATLNPDLMEEALRGCAAELPSLLQTPHGSALLDNVRVDGPVDWDQGLFLVHLFFDFLALNLRRLGDKTGPTRLDVILARDERGGRLLTISEREPKLLRKLKLEPGDKNAMGWLARRVLRKGGLLSICKGEGVEVSVLLPARPQHSSLSS